MSDGSGYRGVKAWRTRKKQQLVDIFGGECGACKHKGSIAVYDFHHIDPSEKEGTMCALANREKMAREASKCVMLCSNCHREVHAGNVDCSTVKRLSYEDIMSGLLIQSEVKAERIARIPMPDKEIMESYTQKQLRKVFGVSWVTAQKWQRTAGVYNPTPITSVTKEELEKLVWEFPLMKVAKILGFKGHESVRRKCEQLNITRPTKGYWWKKKMAEKLPQPILAV